MNRTVCTLACAAPPDAATREKLLAYLSRQLDGAEPELILDGRYAEAGRAQSPYKVTEQEESLAEDVRASLRAHGAEEILCEARKTSHENWLRLADGLGRWRDGGAVMEKLRRKKDAEEISCIKKAAGKLADSGCEEAIQAFLSEAGDAR